MVGGQKIHVEMTEQKLLLVMFRNNLFSSVVAMLNLQVTLSSTIPAPPAFNCEQLSPEQQIQRKATHLLILVLVNSSTKLKLLG